MIAITVYQCVLRKTKTIKVAETFCHHAEHAANIVRTLTLDSPSEKFVVVFVNGQNEVIGAEVVGQGGLHGCAVTPREILRAAIIANASAIIVGHNHPGGNPEPSPEDIATTAAIKSACQVVGIQLLDHVVVTTRNGFRSIEGG